MGGALIEHRHNIKRDAIREKKERMSMRDIIIHHTSEELYTTHLSEHYDSDFHFPDTIRGEWIVPESLRNTVRETVREVMRESMQEILQELNDQQRSADL